MVPLELTTKVTRRGYWSPAASAAPRASASSRVVSDRSGNGKSYLSAKALFSSGVSKLTPKISIPFSVYCEARSRNPLPWAVHPGVEAFG